MNAFDLFATLFATCIVILMSFLTLSLFFYTLLFLYITFFFATRLKMLLDFNLASFKIRYYANRIITNTVTSLLGKFRCGAIFEVCNYVMCLT